MSEKYPTSGTTSGSGSSSTYHVSTPFLSEKGSASGSGHGYPLPYTDLYIEDDELHDIERDSRYDLPHTLSLSSPFYHTLTSLLLVVATEMEVDSIPRAFSICLPSSSYSVES